jgi:hypothetical protein
LVSTNVSGIGSLELRAPWRPTRLAGQGADEMHERWFAYRPPRGGKARRRDLDVLGTRCAAQ